MKKKERLAQEEEIATVKELAWTMESVFAKTDTQETIAVTF